MELIWKVMVGGCEEMDSIDVVRRVACPNIYISYYAKPNKLTITTLTVDPKGAKVMASTNCFKSLPTTFNQVMKQFAYIPSQ